MAKVWIFGAILTLLGGFGLYALMFTKLAQKMFTSKKKNKEIDK